MENKEISGYQTVSEPLRSFDTMVNLAIKGGWVPFGQPYMNGVLICQPMVKYKSE